MIKLAAVSSVAIVLAACHSTQNAAPPPAVATAPVASAPVVKTYPMGQKAGLQGTNVSGGGLEGVRHVNSLHAPSNQVYYFGFDQSVVSPADVRAATIQAQYLAIHHNAKVRLEGNTDDRGSREYNVALGWRRAQAVARILKQQGVAPAQIKMVSYGKEHPAVSGNTEHAWSLNRRVELIYVEK
ncbi:MAG: OmpA family protein [Proteobacteria bacterium]|nr:OmpA family protein [Pseudomonadota bacterium]